MTDKYIMLDMNDPKTDKIAEAISNKTAKKILNLLAEKDLSASEISKELEIPLNTAGYNLDNLIKSGLIEKTSGFLWSTKGKKIEKYKISNKKILISPRQMVRGVIPAIIGTLLVSLILSFVMIDNNSINAPIPPQYSDSYSGIAEKQAGLVESSDANSDMGNDQRIIKENEIVNYDSNNEWAWFLFGAIFALLILVITNILIERRQY